MTSSIVVLNRITATWKPFITVSHYYITILTRHVLRRTPRTRHTQRSSPSSRLNSTEGYHKPPSPPARARLSTGPLRVTMARLPQVYAIIDQSAREGKQLAKAERGAERAAVDYLAVLPLLLPCYTTHLLFLLHLAIPSRLHFSIRPPLQLAIAPLLHFPSSVMPCSIRPPIHIILPHLYYTVPFCYAWLYFLNYTLLYSLHFTLLCFLYQTFTCYFAYRSAALRRWSEKQ